MPQQILKMRSQEFVFSRIKPATIGLMIAAIIPRLPEIPTKDPVYFGPSSAWLTPKPPAPMPDERFVKQRSKTI